MRLNQEQVRDVLARAEEIRLQRGVTPSERDVEEVLSAAVEAGLDRDSVMQAVRERLSVLGEPPKIGDRIFAKSSDGNFYTATIQEVGDGMLKVKFGQGGEHLVHVMDVRPCSFLPGQRVVCPWPNWGWWTCRVLAYDSTKDEIRATDGWGSEEVFAVASVRMAQDLAMPKMPGKLTAWLFTGLVAGGVVGSAITWLFFR